MTQDAIIQVDVVRAPVEDRERNQRRAGSHEQECFLCERGLTAKQADAGWWVHVGGYGALLISNDLDIEADEDLGWFPVGSECAKRVPLDFRQKMAR